MSCMTYAANMPYQRSFLNLTDIGDTGQNSSSKGSVKYVYPKSSSEFTAGKFE